MDKLDHWAALGRRIRTMGPPQVPGPEVVARIAEICNGCKGLTVLLGVTPAYAGLGDDLLAFDGSEGMIAAIWPGDSDRRKAALADWTALPVADGVADQVLGDGSLNAVPDRAVLRAVLSEVRRVLKPEGRAAIRVFARPDRPETAAEVLAASRAGRVESLNVLRWRLASALATGPEHRVAVADILAAVEPLGDLAEFCRTRGMDAGQAQHLSAYRGSSAAYVFPDRAALAADAAAAGLSCYWAETTGYPGARDCPIAVLQRR